MFRVLVILTGVLLYAYVQDGLWLEVLLLGMVLSTFLHHKIATGLFTLGYGFLMFADVKVISVCIALIVGFACGMEKGDYISIESTQ